MRSAAATVESSREPASLRVLRNRNGWAIPASLLLYTSIFLALLLTGPGIRIPHYSFQLLPEEALEEQLVQSLYYLHAQPPLMNSLLGVTLYASRLLGVTEHSILVVLHFLLGLVIVTLFWKVARALRLTFTAQAAATLYIILHPVVYIYLFLFSYTVYEMAFLLVLIWATNRFWESARAKDLVLVCAALCALTFTRSLFHPFWSTAALLFVLLVTPRSSRYMLVGRRHVALAATTVLILLSWPLKNLALFGFFGYSSWLGYNLSRSLPIEKHELSPMFALQTPEDRSAAQGRAFELLPEEFRDVYVLASPVKKSGAPNWNHYAMLNYSSDLQRATLDLLRERPRAFLRKAWSNYQRHSLFAGKNVYSGTFSLMHHGNGMGRWMRIYDSTFFRPLTDRPPRAPLTIYFFAFPLIVVIAMIKAVAGAGRRSPDWRCVTLLLATILWVLAMVLFVDGDEANRIRFPTEPLTVLLFFWILTVPWPRQRQGARKDRRCLESS